MEARERKIRNSLSFTLCMMQLNNLKKTGWTRWGINDPENVGSHVYSTIQLAIGIWSEFDVPVDIERVIVMLAVHETEEPVICDIPLEHDLRKYKKEIGKIAVESMTDCLNRKHYILGLIKEFEAGETKEAKFARYIDKLQYDIMAKVYDEENKVDLNNQEGNPSAKVPNVKRLLDQGKSFSETWMGYGREIFNYPDYLAEISLYAETHNLHEIISSHLEKAKGKVKRYLDSVKK
jgi:5'-deoxynucleotidase YfbR-like HD superfamily hydrolase